MGAAGDADRQLDGAAGHLVRKWNTRSEAEHFVPSAMFGSGNLGLASYCDVEHGQEVLWPDDCRGLHQFVLGPPFVFGQDFHFQCSPSVTRQG